MTKKVNERLEKGRLKFLNQFYVYRYIIGFLHKSFHLQLYTPQLYTLKNCNITRRQ